MAFGDPAAAIAGRTVGGPTLPWNPRKTWVGLLANWAVGGRRGGPRVPLRQPPRAAADSVAILMIGAAIYAFLESVRAGIDDNIVAALPTALAIYQMGLVWPPPLLARRAAVGAWRRRPGGQRRGRARHGRPRRRQPLRRGRRRDRRVPDPRGRRLGRLRAALGVLPAAARWRRAWATAARRRSASRRPTRAGAAPAHVVANCVVAGGAPAPRRAPTVAFVAAFAAALADTLGTEVGTLYGRRPFSPLTLRAGPARHARRRLRARARPRASPGAAAIGLGGLAPRARPGRARLGRDRSADSSARWPRASSRRSDGAFRLRLDHEFANALNTFVGAMLASAARRRARALPT